MGFQPNQMRWAMLSKKKKRKEKEMGNNMGHDTNQFVMTQQDAGLTPIPKK